MRAVLVLAASSAVASAVAASVGTVTEHVALGPAAGKSTTLEFATVSYPSGHSATTADQVTVEAAEDGLDVLGDWQDMELGNVSVRVHAACLACLLASLFCCLWTPVTTLPVTLIEPHAHRSRSRRYVLWLHERCVVWHRPPPELTGRGR